MDQNAENIARFVNYVAGLRGDEKGEAQVFCDRLFQAFGHDGYNAAGATLEWRVKGENATKFADLVWKPRLLLEMKSRGQKLERHYRQAFDYWLKLVPHRPRYVMLCNFDEFWVYDFDLQLEEPVDRIKIVDLPERYAALNFMFPEEKRPLFGNDRVAVTRAAADKVAAVFNAIVGREVDRKVAQRFILQCVVAMFSEDAGLLPSKIFTQLLHDCKAGQSSYDLIGGLFRQMNSPTPAPAGRYQGVQYFNGGIFANIDPVQLAPDEIEALLEAVQEDWSKVQPVIFGSLFESSMDKKERHAYGAHFTSEADIQKVVMPTIVKPWQEKIEKAKTFPDLKRLREELLKFRVLDPACGSGNFLYVAYRELKHIEFDLLSKMHREFPKQAQKETESVTSLVSTKQFFGLDNNPFATELAKVTLMLAKELTIRETSDMLDAAQTGMAFEYEKPLPLDNLDQNIMCKDALFNEWPEADAIIGNPPYQSKTKMVREFGHEYMERLHAAYPEVPGRADYCVYWFRKAHDQLGKNGRAGLVGTNTVRQNYSRIGGLDYIVANGGIITEAVSTQVWSGDAVVHVSIVNWVKGKQAGLKKLYLQKGDNLDSPWESYDLEYINSSLSPNTDVVSAKRLNANIEPKRCFQGQTHGNEGFLLSPLEAKGLIAAEPNSATLIHPYMTGDELLSTVPACPQRCVIDVNGIESVNELATHSRIFERLKSIVLPFVQQKATEEREKTNKMGQRQRHLDHWWHHWAPRRELMSVLRSGSLKRYIACSRITKRPIFEFLSYEINPNDKLQVFALDDDYSFGIICSDVHWRWFIEKCTTLKGDPNYNSESIWDTFPWPQNPNAEAMQKVANAAIALRTLRRNMMSESGSSLREMYRLLSIEGHNPLRDAHAALDQAVQAAYGIEEGEDVLAFLLKLNKTLAAKEERGDKIVGPGLPPSVKERSAFVTEDCVSYPST